MGLIKIYQTSGKLEAEMIKGFLEAQEIQVVLSQESIAQTIGLSVGHLGKVDVLVPEEQAQEAHKLLTAMEAGEFENLPPSSTEDPPDTA